MVIVEDSAPILKRTLSQTCLKPLARTMVMRMVLSFILHRGRMSCSAAAGVVASQAIHRGQLTRFLRRSRWQKKDFNPCLREALLRKETRRGRFVFLIDATMVSQAGKKTENTYSTGNRQRRPRQGRRYNQKKVVRKNVHSFTYGLLLTPSGIRLPFQIPHYTPDYCRKTGREHLTTAEAAARLIRELPLPEKADVVVIGDTAYDAQVVRDACAERGYLWIFPVNPERVFAGKTGQRLKVRSRLKDWTGLSLQTIRLHASTGKYARLRRASQWRMGPKAKPSVYYAHQERREVHSVGSVQLVFSTKKPHLTAATPDDVKILMSNATAMSLRELIELYGLRWQIELFFKELKSTLGFAQYRFESFQAVEGWVKAAIATVLFLEFLRASRLADRRMPPETRAWWERQRLYGLCAAFRQECTGRELKYLSQRLKTPGGIVKLKRVLLAATPKEYRAMA
jgi:Transposase DDE domain